MKTYQQDLEKNNLTENRPKKKITYQENLKKQIK